MTTDTCPTSDIDLYSDEALADPYECYAELRDLGPAVWMRRLGAYTLGRYAEVRQALSDWRTFSSAKGVMLNDEVNDMVAGVVMLCTDPPEHGELRRVVRRPLLPAALRELAARLEEETQSLVEGLVYRGSFDAVSELATHLPVTIVSKLVGLPEEGRERMLEWATASFDSMGPMNERTRAGIAMQAEMMEYGRTRARPPFLAPGGWAQMMFDAGERGEIPAQRCPHLIPDYLAPSLDTTINATTSAVQLFAEHPEQWELVREDPSLVPDAINEVLRLESPVQRFTRYVTTDADLGGVPVAPGSRVLVLYGSANRDERHWPDPTRFDVRRPGSSEHMAFGFGEHACVGQGLARLELRLLLEALAARVRRFEIVSGRRSLNQTLRGWASLEVRVLP